MPAPPTPVRPGLVRVAADLWWAIEHQEGVIVVDTIRVPVSPRRGTQGFAQSARYICFALAFARAGASAEPAGLRAGGSLSSRLTDLVNCPTSPALLTITTSAPVDCSVKPSGSTNPESRIMRAP